MKRFFIPVATVLLIAACAWLALRPSRAVPSDKGASTQQSGAGEQSAGAELRNQAVLEQPAAATQAGAPLVQREALAGTEAPEPVAQESAPEVSAGDLAELRGRFLFPDGSPARDVEVKVHGWTANSERELKFGVPEHWEDPSGKTDVDGRFSFRFDPPRAFQFTLDATSPGYAETSWRWSELPAGEVTDVGEVVLLRSGRIRGRIVDTQGRPLLGDWRVQGETTASGEWEGRDETRVYVLADPATAEFVIDGLPPGRAELSARSRLTNWIDGPLVEVQAGAETLADIVYDGPDNSRRITLVTFDRSLGMFNNPAPGSIVLLGPGGERVAKQVPGSSQSWSFDDLEPGNYDIEIRDPCFEPWRQAAVPTGTALNVQLVGSAAVQVTVTTGEGQVLEDYRLLMRYPKANFRPNELELRGAQTAAPAGGVYRGLMPTTEEAQKGPPPDLQNLKGNELAKALHDLRSRGLTSFELEASAAGFAPSSVTVENLAPGETRSIAIVLQPAARVLGRIQGVEASEAARVTVVLAEASAGAQRMLDHQEGMWTLNSRAALIRETESGDDGAFEFTGLPAGSYRLVARFHQGFHGEFGPFDLDLGQTREAHILAPAHGSIDGLILAAPEDLEHAWIEARPAGTSQSHDDDWSLFEAEPPPRARVDADGKFLLSPLAAGTYELRLHHSSQALARDPGLWKPGALTAPVLGLVTLPGAQRVSVEFDLTKQRRGLIHCQTSVDGEPAVGWRVEALCESQEGVEIQRTEARTGPNGVAHLPQLPPGTWKLALVDNDGLWRAWAKEPLVLEPGAEVSLSIEVALHPGQLLVLDASSDQPRRNQTVLFGQGAQQSSVKTDADGKLNLRLPPGTYGLRAGSFSGSPEEFILQLGKPSSPLEWTPSGPQTAAVRL